MTCHCVYVCVPVCVSLCMCVCVCCRRTENNLYYLKSRLSVTSVWAEVPLCQNEPCTAEEGLQGSAGVDRGGPQRRKAALLCVRWTCTASCVSVCVCIPRLLQRQLNKPIKGSLYRKVDSSDHKLPRETFPHCMMRTIVSDIIKLLHITFSNHDNLYSEKHPSYKKCISKCFARNKKQCFTWTQTEWT